MLIPFGTLAASGGVAGSYELIETALVSTSTPSVTFNNLGTYSSTYKHLQIRCLTRSNPGSTGINLINVNLNSDSGSNYARHALFGNGSTVASNSATSQTSLGTGLIPEANQATNAFAANIIDFLDCYSTSKNKTVRTFAGVHGSANNSIMLGSGLWMNTNSITSISLANPALLFITGSRFSLYGIRG